MVFAIALAFPSEVYTHVHLAIRLLRPQSVNLRSAPGIWAPVWEGIRWDALEASAGARERVR